jgi:hypothetical protein
MESSNIQKHAYHETVDIPDCNWCNQLGHSIGRSHYCCCLLSALACQKGHRPCMPNYEPHMADKSCMPQNVCSTHQSSIGSSPTHPELILYPNLPYNLWNNNSLCTVQRSHYRLRPVSNHNTTRWCCRRFHCLRISQATFL